MLPNCLSKVPARFARFSRALAARPLSSFPKKSGLTTCSNFFLSHRYFSDLSLESLPVIDTMVNKVLTKPESSPLKRTAVIYVHHPLQTSVNLIDAILRLGAKANNFFVLGKHYSECTSVVDKVKNLGVHYQPCTAQIGLGKFSHSFIRDINLLWSNADSRLKRDEIDNVLILDHGGHALTFTPASILEKYKVVGVEKTTAGLTHPGNIEGLPFPVIEVASCAAKRILESPLIAEAVVAKLQPLISLKDKNLICGVVGYGAIGKAVTEKLLSMGHKVIVYDNDPSQLKIVKNAVCTSSLSTLMVSADYIFGCTGRDSTLTIDFKILPKDKTLISCSSEDKEFLSLLQTIQKKQNGKVATKPLNDVEYKTDLGATIRILRGGFPINFDNSGESVPANDIQLTRALVLGSVLQAAHFFEKPHLPSMVGGYMLDPKIQHCIVSEWLKYQPPGRFSPDTLDKFLKGNYERWIAEHSGGTYEPCHIPGASCDKSQAPVTATPVNNSSPDRIAAAHRLALA